jgi:hypothetical protein
MFAKAKTAVITAAISVIFIPVVKDIEYPLCNLSTLTIEVEF